MVVISNKLWCKALMLPRLEEVNPPTYFFSTAGTKNPYFAQTCFMLLFQFLVPLVEIVISYRGRKTMSFFGTSPRAQPEGECLKNHRFECEVRSLLFAAESKKQGQKGPFLTSPDASKNTVFETPWQKSYIRVEKLSSRKNNGVRGTKLLFYSIFLHWIIVIAYHSHWIPTIPFE